MMLGKFFIGTVESDSVNTMCLLINRSFWSHGLGRAIMLLVLVIEMESLGVLICGFFPTLKTSFMEFNAITIYKFGDE